MRAGLRTFFRFFLLYLCVKFTDSINSGTFIEVNNVDMTDGELIVAHGDSAPTILCFTNTGLYSTRVWRYRGENLPSGITERFQTALEAQNLHLEWSRPLDFTDSGQYMCTFSNSEGEAESILDITVTRKAISPSVCALCNFYINTIIFQVYQLLFLHILSMPIFLDSLKQFLFQLDLVE